MKHFLDSLQTLSPISSDQIQLLVAHVLVQELLRELGRELEQTVGQVEGVQQMHARMELEKMGLQVGQNLVVVIVTKSCQNQNQGDLRQF